MKGVKHVLVLFLPPARQALARVSSPDWWLKYRGVGSSLKGPWGNVLGMHTLFLPIWGHRAAHYSDCKSKNQQQGKQQQQQRQKQQQQQMGSRGGRKRYSESRRVLQVKSQFDRKKRSYEAHFVRIQWDRQSVKAQVRSTWGDVRGVDYSVVTTPCSGSCYIHNAQTARYHTIASNWTGSQSERG